MSGSHFPSSSRSSSPSSSHTRSSSPSGSRSRSRSPTSVRGYFGYPQRNRSPSPVRFWPVVDHAPRGPRPTKPLYPWRRPPVTAASPAFEPAARDFTPGSVQIPREFIDSLPSNEAHEAARFVWTIGNQHRAYVKRHVELVQMMQYMERDMQRLEADLMNWEHFGFGLLDPIPLSLCSHCRKPREKSD